MRIKSLLKQALAMNLHAITCRNRIKNTQELWPWSSDDLIKLGRRRSSLTMYECTPAPKQQTYCFWRQEIMHIFQKNSAMIHIFPILQNESRFFACEYSLQNPSFVECYNVDIKAHIALLVLVKLKHFGFIWSKRTVNIPQSASSIHSMASFCNSFITCKCSAKKRFKSNIYKRNEPTLGKTNKQHELRKLDFHFTMLSWVRAIWTSQLC